MAGIPGENMSKYNLRARSPSQPEIDLNTHKSVLEENSDQSSVTTLQQLETESEHTQELHKQQPPKPQSEEVIEIPVINMTHFKEVEPSHKLDLLMAAINKINTNFHYKFDELRRELTDLNLTVQNITPKYQQLKLRTRVGSPCG